MITLKHKQPGLTSCPLFCRLMVGRTGILDRLQNAQLEKVNYLRKIKRFIPGNAAIQVVYLSYVRAFGKFSLSGHL